MRRDCDVDNEEKLRMMMMVGRTEKNIIEATEQVMSEQLTNESRKVNKSSEVIKSIRALEEILDESDNKSKTKLNTNKGLIRNNKRIKKRKVLLCKLLRATLVLYKEKEFFMLLPHIIPFLKKLEATKQQTINETPLSLSQEEKKLLNALLISEIIQTNWKEYMPLLLHALILLGQIFIEIKSKIH